MNKELLISRFPWLFDVVQDFNMKIKYGFYEYEKDNHLKTKFNSMFGTDQVVVAYKCGKIIVEKDGVDFGGDRMLLVCKNGTILQLSSSEWAAISIIRG